MSNLNNLTGKRFGLLSVVARAEDRKKNRYWKVKCDCGVEKEVAGVSLTRGVTVTCGASHHRVTHGETIAGKKSPEYSTWLAIKQRCFNKNTHSAKHYGGRGIKMCERWANSFEAFLKDMGRRPSAEHSIDRIDNDGPYSPSNCRWATRIEQMRNTRAAHLVTIAHETKTLTEWCEYFGISKSMVRSRVSLGWNDLDALLTPKKPGGRKPKTASPRTP